MWWAHGGPSSVRGLARRSPPDSESSLSFLFKCLSQKAKSHVPAGRLCLQGIRLPWQVRDGHVWRGCGVPSGNERGSGRSSPVSKSRQLPPFAPQEKEGSVDLHKCVMGV